ncbi:hypothetical protein MPSEU_000442700 [Mayamaea pseudoterrestris]|nr:hypothetical protein MPSEU_000442700 [Mayamaea pseudoterrestris]
MEASIQSVLSYLASEGLSQASLNQLSSSLRNGQHVSVMKSSQEYMRCTMVTTATLTVFLDAWHSVSTYLALLYRQAHSNYMQLRRSHKINMLAGALQKKMQLGELCCQAQKEGLLLERSKKQLAWKEEEQRQRQLQSCDGPAAPVRIA